jgi:DNA polymerase-3 subunit epsilon
MPSAFGKLFGGRSFASKLLGSNQVLPEKWKACSLNNVPFLSIDLELTSLDTQVAKITSIGWLQGMSQQVDLSSAFYKVIRASGDLAQSPVIHGLTAKDLAGGEHIAAAVDELKNLAESHIWILHNASLDMKVITRVAETLSLPKTQITTLDTMLLEMYFLNKTQDMVKQDALTLEQCRQRHELPSAPNHNALDDALATLTLAFSQLYQLDKSNSVSIRDLLQTKAFKVFTIGQAEVSV